MDTAELSDRVSRPISGQGIVYLVGAGPGDPELITVRGLSILRRAEVLVYDRLVHPALVDEAPSWAEKIFVGKEPRRHTMEQDDINQLLVDKARLGHLVVRLKGGDPFVFGRGGEEAQTLVAAGIPWEVIPGVSSSLAAPAAAGIPLTHRGVAASFAVLTGQRAAELAAEDPAWSGLARIDTLVVLMGVARLPWIAANLRRHGRSPSTPVAVIERGTLPEERVMIGTLADITRQAGKAGVRSPATIVVGEVVKLRSALGEVLQASREAVLG